MRIDEERVVYDTERLASVLSGAGIDLRSKGGRALLCCAFAACRNKGSRVKDLCAWYAKFKGSNVWAVHKQMSIACRRAACGMTPGAVLRWAVREVTK